MVQIERVSVSTSSVRSNGNYSSDSRVRMALLGSARVASGFCLAYAITAPFRKDFGVFGKLEILIAKCSLVLMSATPLAVRTWCRCWIAAFGLRYTRPAAVEMTCTDIWDIGGIEMLFVSRAVCALLNVVNSSTFVGFSDSSGSWEGLHFATGVVFSIIPSEFRTRIGRIQPRRNCNRGTAKRIVFGT